MSKMPRTLASILVCVFFVFGCEHPTDYNKSLPNGYKIHSINLELEFIKNAHGIAVIPDLTMGDVRIPQLGVCGDIIYGEFFRVGLVQKEYFVIDTRLSNLNTFQSWGEAKIDIQKLLVDPCAIQLVALEEF